MVIGIFVAAFLFLLAFISFGWNKHLFAPAFLSNFMWAVFVFLYNISSHSLYPLWEQFYLAIILWNLCFTLGSYLINQKTFEEKKFVFRNTVLNIYFILVVIIAPIAMYKTYQKAMEGPTDVLVFNLRLLSTNVDGSNFSLGIIGYVYSLAAVALMLEFLNNKGKYYKNIKIVVLLILNIGLSILTVSRTSFFFLIISLFVIFAFKTKVKTKHFLYVFVSIIALFVGMTFLKDSFDDGVNIADSFSLYLFSGMAAFETVTPAPADYDFGANVFRIFYAIGNSLGFGTEPVSNILDYVSVPENTNVYTFMYPFFRDFGYVGIVVFGFLYGILFQYIYLNARSTKSFFLVFFAYLISVLLFQFLGDTLMTNLSTSLQYFIIARLAFKSEEV